MKKMIILFLWPIEQNKIVFIVVHIRIIAKSGPKAPKILIFFNLHFDPGNRRISKSALLPLCDRIHLFPISPAFLKARESSSTTHTLRWTPLNTVGLHKHRKFTTNDTHSRSV